MELMCARKAGSDWWCVCEGLHVYGPLSYKLLPTEWSKSSFLQTSSSGKRSLGKIIKTSINYSSTTRQWSPSSSFLECAPSSVLPMHPQLVSSPTTAWTAFSTRSLTNSLCLQRLAMPSCKLLTELQRRVWMRKQGLSSGELCSSMVSNILAETKKWKRDNYTAWTSIIKELKIYKFLVVVV